ncbi:MAG: large conductance mechanosensitive channel protein MscL [Candidatus Gracilibacteria bacterium]
MIQDFKKFLIKGNAIDLAVGFMFGAAFATIVKSFITNIIMPPIGLLLGKVDFSSLYISLSDKKYESFKALEEAGAPAIKYGLFINEFIGFIVLGFIIFYMVRNINKLQKKEENKPKPKAADLIVLEEIRDALNKK